MTDRPVFVPLAEAFPTVVRYQGSAFTLSGVNLLFAAPAPMLASWSMGTFDSPLPLAITAGVFILIAIITLLRTKEGRTLEGEIPTYKVQAQVRKAESI